MTAQPGRSGRTADRRVADEDAAWQRLGTVRQPREPVDFGPRSAAPRRGRAVAHEMSTGREVAGATARSTASALTTQRDEEAEAEGRAEGGERVRADRVLERSQGERATLDTAKRLARAGIEFAELLADTPAPWADPVTVAEAVVSVHPSRAACRSGSPPPRRSGQDRRSGSG